MSRLRRALDWRVTTPILGGVLVALLLVTVVTGARTARDALDNGESTSAATARTIDELTRKIDDSARVIRDLRAEIAALRRQIRDLGAEPVQPTTTTTTTAAKRPRSTSTTTAPSTTTTTSHAHSTTTSTQPCLVAIDGRCVPTHSRRSQ